MSERFEYIIHPNVKKFINEFLIILKSTKKFQDCPLENLFFYFKRPPVYFIKQQYRKKNPKLPLICMQRIITCALLSFYLVLQFVNLNDYVSLRIMK